MQEHTIRILRKNLNYIADYRQGKLSLNELVSSLEGSINALEEQLPEQFYQNWDKSWSELEIALVLDKEELYSDVIHSELIKLESLIVNIVQSQSPMEN